MCPQSWCECRTRTLYFALFSRDSWLIGGRTKCSLVCNLLMHKCWWQGYLPVNLMIVKVTFMRLPSPLLLAETRRDGKEKKKAISPPVYHDTNETLLVQAILPPSSHRDAEMHLPLTRAFTCNCFCLCSCKLDWWVLGYKELHWAERVLFFFFFFFFFSSPSSRSLLLAPTVHCHWFPWSTSLFRLDRCTLAIFFLSLSLFPSFFAPPREQAHTLAHPFLTPLQHAEQVYHFHPFHCPREWCMSSLFLLFSFVLEKRLTRARFITHTFFFSFSSPAATAAAHVTDGYTTEDLVFLWKEGDPVQVTKTLHLPRFTLQKFKTDYCTSKTNTGKSW